MSTGTQVRYLVDSTGRRTAVMLSVKQFEKMVRELEDLRDAQYADEVEATAEGYIDLAELRRRLDMKRR